MALEPGATCNELDARITSTPNSRGPSNGCDPVLRQAPSSGYLVCVSVIQCVTVWRVCMYDVCVCVCVCERVRVSVGRAGND